MGENRDRAQKKDHNMLRERNGVDDARAWLDQTTRCYRKWAWNTAFDLCPGFFFLLLFFLV